MQNYMNLQNAYTRVTLLLCLVTDLPWSGGKIWKNDFFFRSVKSQGILKLVREIWKRPEKFGKVKEYENNPIALRVCVRVCPSVCLSISSNDFFSETTELIVTKFHIQPTGL